MAKKKKEKTPGELLVCRNPKALKRFEIAEKLECGMVLQGSEVKSLRDRQGDLDGAFAAVHNGELWLHKMLIAPYKQATAYGHEPRQRRKLLAHRHQIERLTGRLATRGFTLIPLQVYFKGGVAKVELGLAKSKDMEDKRQDLKRKADLRDTRISAGKHKR